MEGWVLFIAPGFEIGLQNNDRGEFILMPGAFFTRDAKFDARGAGDLCAVRFVPHFDGDIGLALKRFGEAPGSTPRRVWLPVFSIRLPDNDSTYFVFGGDLCHLGGIDHPRDVRDDFQWAGDGGGRVAEGKADAFFTVVNCEDSHGFMTMDNGR